MQTLYGDRPLCLCLTAILFVAWRVIQYINPFTPKSVNYKLKISFCKIWKNKQAPHGSTAHKLSFEWSHTRVTSTYVKVRNTNYYFKT